ncbi:MAG TPA: pilin [Candidatus Saccharimonadales bacterium]|nr:pilin [Candidatus Saccharimonadales bacterium]
MYKKFFAGILVLSALLLPAYTSYAAGPGVKLYDDICNQANVGPAADSAPCKDSSEGGNPIYGPNGIINKVVDLITLITGLAAVVSIIWAGIKLATSGNNPEDVGKAREYIQYAIIGLVLAAIAQALVRLVLFKIGV